MKKEINETRRDMMMIAWSMNRKCGYSMSEAMKKAWQVVKLQARMRTGIVQFYYIKKSTGELRQAFGTTDPHRYEYTPSENGRRGNFADCIQYYDTEKQGFRMFKTYNLVNVI